MDEYYEANKRRWNELVEIHANSAEYDLDGFLAGNTSLHQVELNALGDVTDKSLLHLQCHFGLDTLSWARLGAKVTGVDFSETAIELAKKLAKRVGQEATFICCNLYDLPNIHTDQYDIVFTSFGVLCWLQDVDTWGRIIAQYLNPRGIFLLVESHPIVHIFDDDHPTQLKIKYPYWHTTEPLSYDFDGTYVESAQKLTNTRGYEWHHTISDILNALLRAGLTILEIHEYPHLPWKPFPFAQKTHKEEWRLDGDPLPLCWSIKATQQDR